MKHECNFHNPEEDVYGEAITYCTENKKGELWVGNGEYGSQVNFCPECGYKAKIQIKGE